MNRDDAKQIVAWVKKHDDALDYWKNRLKRRDAIITFFREVSPDTAVAFSVPVKSTYENGYTSNLELAIPHAMARSLMLTDIAAQITRARIAAMKAGVDPALLFDPGPSPPQKK